jgi:hypothetical protein
VYRRFVVVVLVGLLAGSLCAMHLALHPQIGAADLTWPLHSARAFLAGQNPYRVTVGPPYSPTTPLYYPFPAVLALLPLAPLPDALAGGLFVGLSTALLAWGLRDKRTWLIFASAPFWQAVITAQWSIVLAAALSLSWLAPLIACKPTIGALALAIRPRAALPAFLVAALSLLALPSWPFDWWANTRAAPQTIAALWCPLLIVAAVHWRKPPARILLVASFVPVRLLWYDQLALFFALDTPRARLLWLVCGWAARIAWVGLAGQDNDAAPWFVVVGVYLPVLAILFIPRALPDRSPSAHRRSLVRWPW